jgi:hypothetical protein
MSHQANPDFWTRHHRPPIHIQKSADQNFALLKQDPRRPSLHLKKVGRHGSVRVGDHDRAVGVQSPRGILW